MHRSLLTRVFKPNSERTTARWQRLRRPPARAGARRPKLELLARSLRARFFLTPRGAGLSSPASRAARVDRLRTRGATRVARACGPLLAPSLLALSLLAAACGSSDRELGELALGLTTQQGGVVYRLSSARFLLEGPERRELDASGQDELALELPAGAYRLSLLEGFQLTRADDPGTPVAARLVSQNPAPVLISAGEASRVTFRFELADGAQLGLGGGSLRVGIEIGPGDAGGGAASDCALGLRINEVDYEQASSDNAEFIELINAGTCDAALAELTVELVNGSDGSVYARYALAETLASLGPGERLVIGDAELLAALPPDAKSLPLNGSGLQNGPDGVRIARGELAIDAFSYEGAVAGSTESNAGGADEGELALARCPDGFDTGDGASDFRLSAPTPAAANSCS